MDIVQTQLSHTSQMPQQVSFPPDIIHRHLAQEGCQPTCWSIFVLITPLRLERVDMRNSC